jgi:O-antigen/teichoic acid export membrane protein
MGIVIRRSGYTALLSYLGFFIGYVNMLWLLPYVFKPEEIGLIRLLSSVAAMFAILASFGGTQIATKYYPYFADTVQRRAAFFKLLSGLACVGVILFIVFFICLNAPIKVIYSNKSPLFITYLWALIPLTISLILYGLIESVVIVQGYPLVPAILREIYIRILLTISTLLFLGALISFSGFVKLMALLYCVSPLMLLYYAHRKDLVPLTGSVHNIQRSELGELAQFGTFAFLGNAGAVLLANIDSVVLSAYSGLISTGIYGIALFIAVIIEIPKRSLSQVLIPLVVKANKTRDIQTLEILYKKSSINQLLIGAAVFLVIWLNIDGIFSLIPHGDIYREGKWVVFYVSLAKLYDMLTGINAEIVGTSQYYKIDLLFFSIISIIGIGLNFFLIPLYGVVGAALAVFLSTVLFNTTRFIFIATVMKIQPFSKKTFSAVLCIALTYGCISLLPTFPSNLLTIGFRTVLTGIMYGVLVLSFHVSDDVTYTFQKIVTRFIGQK